jgi:hypothetical protein
MTTPERGRDGLREHPMVASVKDYLDNAGIIPETLRYAATHEALCRSWISGGPQVGHTITLNDVKSYEIGYRDGESSAHADWFIALDDDRLNRVAAASASLGVSIQDINDALDGGAR